MNRAAAESVYRFLANFPPREKGKKDFAAVKPANADDNHPNLWYDELILKTDTACGLESG